MNSLHVSLLDSAILSAAEDAAPRATTRAAVPVAPAVLWRQSLGAHEHSAPVRWTLRGGYAVLGTLTATSIFYAASALCHAISTHDGLHAAVQALMSR